MLRFKTYLVVVHIAGWLLFMAFPLLFLNGGSQSANQFLILKTSSYWIFCLTYITLFYINAYLLIPRLFLKKKYVWYAFIIIILLNIVYFSKPYDGLVHATETRQNNIFKNYAPLKDVTTGQYLPPRPPSDRGKQGPGYPPPDSNNMDAFHGGLRAPGSPPPGTPPGPGFDRGNPPPPQHVRFLDTTSIFLFVMIMALSTAIKIVQQWKVTEQRATRAEADKTTAELSFLKAQINPHFLFNTLNNIYTLALIQDEHAADSIMKLSNIMRYVTDDATEDFVPLQNEIDCINDYIELQKLRLGEKTPIDLHISGDAANRKIAPLILMTFIENVFKFGVSKREQSPIIIKIAINESSISFFSQNRIFADRDETKRGGIGLKNTRQRLAYSYPGKHVLNINTGDNLYSVILLLES